jgi:hypothetical protein
MGPESISTRRLPSANAPVRRHAELKIASETSCTSRQRHVVRSFFTDIKGSAGVSAALCGGVVGRVRVRTGAV